MSLIACLLVSVGCDPHMYDEVSALRDAKRADIAGSWICVDHTEVTLRPDGKAVIRLLDGQEFDCDDGWRLSGTGTWELTDKPMGWTDGQHVRVALTSRTASTTRAPVPDESLDEPAERAAAPEAYTWTFELRRDSREELELFFFFGDPDSRSTYVLESKQRKQRKQPGTNP